MDLIKRTEVLSAERDLRAIKAALEKIASGIVPVKPTTQVVVKDGDPFFEKIHMSKEHMDAWDKEFNTPWFMSVGLMEECAELQQAASKYYRKYRVTLGHEYCAAEKAAMIEEMAHVLIDIRMVCNNLHISPEDIQKEIMKKYPGGYLGKEDYYADNAKYVSVDCGCD